MFTTLERARIQQATWAYIQAIRNPLKRHYALLMIGHLSEGMPEPERPSGLSFMAAQAVRMQLAELRRE
jgi:hypothetical protein